MTCKCGDFPKLGGPHNEDYSFSGSILAFPLVLGKVPCEGRQCAIRPLHTVRVAGLDPKPESLDKPQRKLWHLGLRAGGLAFEAYYRA